MKEADCPLHPPSAMVGLMPPHHLSNLKIAAVSESQVERAAASLEGLGTSFGRYGRELSLLQATDSDRRLGLLGIDFVPGRTASLIGPEIDAPQEIAGQIARELLMAARGLLQQRQVSLGQVLLDRQKEPESTWYRDCGYDTLIDVDLLVRTIKEPILPPFSRPPEGLQWIEYRQANRARFLRVLGDSYQQSQDCPALSGLRDLEDVLAGHAAGGPFRPELWQLLHLGGEDVGCLLLCEQPQAAQCEITYLGLLPQFRRHGLGSEAIRHALGLVRDLGYHRLIVAVDVENESAQRLYSQRSFICFSRKQVQICIFPFSQ